MAKSIRVAPFERFVIWSDEFGVFLGDGKWSKVKNGCGVDKAPSYPRIIGIKVCQVLSLPDTRLREVKPDKISGLREYATEQACVRAGMPHWNPSLYVNDDSDA